MKHLLIYDFQLNRLLKKYAGSIRRRSLKLAFEGKKSYKKSSLKCKKLVNYCVIYRDYKEAELTPKAELFAKPAILMKQYIKSSDLALLYSEEDTLLNKKVVTKEDYDMMYYIFVNCKLTAATKAVDYKYKCSRNDIKYDMNLIDQWYNESLQVLERCKENTLFSQVEGTPLSKFLKMQIPHFPGKWWEIVENAALR
ncbi:hypothetical protein C1646_771544 [Rhizophagus diaphanus]|nr:hypothetical protein C1646_771544 [Rhizophagus diaphanus] [Rhizophagus sp. MUCL 43196]